MMILPSQEVHCVVGLGNPGSEYATTRHNIGFMLIDHLASRFGVSLKRENRFNGHAAKATVKGQTVHLLQPMTFMNRSGMPTVQLLNYYKAKADSQLLVICDDVALDFGVLRLKPEGSSGGHNGLKNIEAHLHSRSYARLKMGVGKQIEGQKLEDYVLGRFSSEEMAAMPALLERAAQAVEMWLTEDIAKVMNCVNTNIKKVSEPKGDRPAPNKENI